ncbi:MAG: lamin tail domain-containing protein [Verrucomicrobia bacterium]|nr:lamin tail domain-containing protein [Verrucomicrobiota bacterium]
MSDTITIQYTGPELPSPVGKIVINEIMYNPLVPQAEFIELHNPTTASYDLSNWRLNGVGYTFPPGTLLGPGAFVVIAQNRDAFAAAYGFGVLPLGEFPGALQNNGERLSLIRPGATPAEDLVIAEVRYENELPWPPQAHGLGPSCSSSIRRGTTGASAIGPPLPSPTPCAPRRVGPTPSPSPSPAFPLLFLNEVQPVNLTGPRDQAGDRDPWVELYNAGTTALDLSGFYLTADLTQLTAWAFPAGTTIGPKEFRLVWTDGEPGESVPGEPHTSFRLAPTNGTIALVRLQAGAPAVVDYLSYRDQPDGLSFGSYPDGQARDRRLFHLPTPGATNNPGALPVTVFVNEWMASNSGIVLDPADGDPDDWFELYNAGPTTVNLSAYTLTDDLANPAKFIIPNGTLLPAGGFLLVWADEETNQTAPGHLHVNFRLAAGGESLGLYTPDGQPVDVLTFPAQSDNVSQGRFPDGYAEPFLFLDVPTPGAANVFATLNQPPVLGSIGPRTVDEGQTVTFTATATDPDAGQQLTFSLLGAPAGAQIHPVTGAFTWTTTETDGPGEFTFIVRVTDNGTPPRWDSETVTIVVREVNQPPALLPLADRTIDEGDTLAFFAVATDPDLPPQTLRFRLEPGAPAGATIGETTGEFTWTPPKTRGRAVMRSP